MLLLRYFSDRNNEEEKRTLATPTLTASGSEREPVQCAIDKG